MKARQLIDEYGAWLDQKKQFAAKYPEYADEINAAKNAGELMVIVNKIKQEEA